jgi:ribosomal protein S27AE
MSIKPKSEYTIAFFGALLSILFTAIYDWIKEKPIMFTLGNIVKWLWNNIFEFSLTLWQIILGIILIVIIKNLFKKVNPENNTKNNSEWLNYLEDSFDGLKWKWSWKNNGYNKYKIDDLKPICSKCGTSMIIHDNIYSLSARCPRCEHYLERFKAPNEIIHLIHDNIDRDLYKEL